MLYDKVSRVLLISRFKNLSNLRILHGRCQALAIANRTTERQSPRFYSSEIQQSPKLAKEKIQSSVQKITRKPLVKDFYKGKVDVDVLAFPEVLNPDEIANLDYMMEQVRYLFKTQVDSAEIDRNGKIPDEVLQMLKQIGMFGLAVSEEYGGIKVNETSVVRLMEICGSDSSIGLTLNYHQNVACHLLEVYGTDQQKRKYLPKLSTGEYVGAVCMAEERSGNDLGAMETNFELNPGENSYCLKGKKSLVTNGGLADVFVVFGMTNVTAYDGQTTKTLAAFIVDKTSKGVSVSTQENNLGVRGLNLCSVNFQNVKVPAENLLKDLDKGLEIAFSTLSRSRLMQATLISGLTKELLNETIRYCIQREQFGESLVEYELVKERIAKMAMITYAIESMVYLTAALKDSTVNPDLTLESTATKLFASMGLWECINCCLEIYGTSGYSKNSPIERILRDAKAFSFIDGTNDVLQVFVSHVGMKHYAGDNAEGIEELRNPSFFPVKSFKKMLADRFIENDKYKLEQDIRGYIHPSLGDSGDLVEKAVMKYGFVVEKLLIRYGKEIMQQQMHLRKLSDISVSMYAMIATLSRSSRSYCIGLNNADTEINLANLLCHERSQVIQRTFAELELGDWHSPNPVFKRVADVLFKDKGYSISNATMRTWD